MQCFVRIDLFAVVWLQLCSNDLFTLFGDGIHKTSSYPICPTPIYGKPGPSNGAPHIGSYEVMLIEIESYVPGLWFYYSSVYSLLSYFLLCGTP